jgi:hypothetical protein
MARPQARQRSGASGDAEDVWDRRLKALGREAKALDLLDLKAGAHDRRSGVAGRMTAAGDRREQAAVVDRLQEEALGLAVRDHVLVEGARRRAEVPA